MGRTGPTVREQLDRLEDEWQPFRRSLRRRNQPAFDGLFERARAHAHAASQQNARDPWRAFVMTVLLAQEAELRTRREDETNVPREDGTDVPREDGTDVPREDGTDACRDGDGVQG